MDDPVRISYNCLGTRLPRQTVSVRVRVCVCVHVHMCVCVCVLGAGGMGRRMGMLNHH